MSNRPIQFYFRGAIRQVSGLSPTRSVLQWLREDEQATGTKEGCAEGDCGACTVVLGERDASAPGGLRLSAINACIRLLPTLDGKALFTVEDLTRGPSLLHPVQQSMVDCHAAQCGFCTPGIVMSLWADYESRSSSPSRKETTDTLSGNLCRCTGYRPILDAAAAAWQLPRIALDRAPVRAALDTLAQLPALEIEDAGQRFSAPRTLEALAGAILARPQALILAGSTDIGLWVTKQLRSLDDIIWLGAVDELRSIAHDGTTLTIGAGATLSEAFAALVADDPEWEALAQRFASVPVRNAGTLGGNVANGSPIGDSMPALIALGTTVVLQKGDRLRTLPLEDLYLGYQKSAREAGEFVRALKVPALASSPQRVFRSWKVAKRQDQDISAVCAGFALELDSAGTLSSVRIAFGGMAATPKRASHCEAALLGRQWNEASLIAAQAALAEDYAPLSDMRASAAYRSQVAQNLLRRLWLESGIDHPATPSRLDTLQDLVL